MGRLNHKVALITGAAGGLGAEIARCFAREGAQVVVADLRATAAEAVAAAIHAEGGTAMPLELDVADEASWVRGLTAVLERFGDLDILVNNAGLVAGSVPIENREVDDWDRVMAVNVRGVFLGTKHAIAAMRSSGGGSIINLSSLAALGQGQISDALYAASKGAVSVFTKVTAAQLAGEGIRCNSIHPGPIDSEMLRSVLVDPAAIDRRLARIPMARLGRASEVAAAALYLASDESSFTTGVALTVDGGGAIQ